MSDEYIEKWANYYRYFEIHTICSFDYFLRLKEKGVILRKGGVIWTKR